MLGHSFAIGPVSATSSLDEDDVIEALEHAIAARILVEDKAVPDVVSFSHALVRETLYQDMSAARRVRLHERAAEALEPSATGEQFAELAHHFLEAAAPGRAGHGHGLVGTIAAENGSTWTVNARNGTAYTVTITPQTQFGTRRTKHPLAGMSNTGSVSSSSARRLRSIRLRSGC